MSRKNFDIPSLASLQLNLLFSLGIFSSLSNATDIPHSGFFRFHFSNVKLYTYESSWKILPYRTFTHPMCVTHTKHKGLRLVRVRQNFTEALISLFQRTTRNRSSTSSNARFSLTYFAAPAQQHTRLDFSQCTVCVICKDANLTIRAV